MLNFDVQTLKMKNIAKIYAPPAPHMVGDGFRVHNFIPSLPALSMQRMDPFIMLDYGSKFVFPPAPNPKGVGVHPHRGFETVTIAYKGQVAHHDSFGNSGIINEGDVQWMTAGSGIAHSERFEDPAALAGGALEMIQTWVALPEKEEEAKLLPNTSLEVVKLTPICSTSRRFPADKITLLFGFTIQRPEIPYLT